MNQFLSFAVVLFVASWLVGPLFSKVLQTPMVYLVEWQLGQLGIKKEEIHTRTSSQHEIVREYARQSGTDTVDFGRAIVLGLIPHLYHVVAPDTIPALVLNGAPLAVMFVLRHDRLIFVFVTVFVVALGLLYL